MSRIITQETFNEAVKENIEVLGLSFQEAVEETVKQFETLQVDLSNIVKDVIDKPLDTNEIENAVNVLNSLVKSKKVGKEVLEPLQIIQKQCQKGLQYKVFAGKCGAYDGIISALLLSNDKEIKIECFKCLIALMTKQPDLLNEEGVNGALKVLDCNDLDLKKLCLKWIKECCILHEMNRQSFYDKNILDKIKVMLKESNIEILPDVLAVCRALVLDDDVRVEFGRAHEHARGIASENLVTLTQCLSKYKENDIIINELLLTLSALLVRNEFCKTVDEAGGLEMIKDILTYYIDNEKINRQCFKLLKALAGNDDCKSHIVQNGLASPITASLNKHQKSIPTSASALSCIAALTLRNPHNSNVFFEAQVPEVIIETMKLHPKEKSIQKSGSWAIRNMVSRSKNQCNHFLELGVEEVLTSALNTFKDCEYDVKSALRDLGCNVQLKEEWTGKGGKLNV